MAIFHQNFGVFQSEDPMEDLLLATVANLKHPPKIPTEAEPEKVSAKLLRDPMVAGLHIPTSESFIKEN